MASGRALAEQVLAFDPDLAASRALAKRKVLPDMQHPVAGFFGFKPSDQALRDTSLYRGALSSPDNSPREKSAPGKLGAQGAETPGALWRCPERFPQHQNSM